MDQQWGSFAESPTSTRQARYAPHTLPSHHSSQNNVSMGGQMNHDGYAQQPMPNRTSTMPMMSPTVPQNRGGEYIGDRDGDIPMEDADQFKPKHQSRPSGHQRQHSAQLIQEESSAARRYSPMNLSPASPYGPTAQSSSQGTYSSYTPQTAVRGAGSPTRSNSYMSPSQSYYASPPSKSYGAWYFLS
jgi:dual specificity protein kinase YAK1